MTSPVDTSVKWARSGQTGAPTLTGQTGSLIALLDALLVNGWGLQTATSVVVSGGVATATFPSNHAAEVGSTVLVAGATSLTDLNGEQKITAVAPNVLKWATAAANGTATGTITVKMAPAGWSKPFSGTNLAAYKSADVTANGHYLRVQDTGTTEARVRGYETMSAISTGTGLFPTNTQVSGGMYWGKSNYADSTQIQWVFAADSRFFYLLVRPYTTPCSYVIWCFGDPLARSPSGDPFSTTIFGSPDASWSSYGLVYFSQNPVLSPTYYVPRIQAGTGTAVNQVQYRRDHDFPNSVPNKVDGSLELTPIHQRADVISPTRSVLPGILQSHQRSTELFLPDIPSVIKVSGSNKDYLALNCGQDVISASDTYALLFDITGPWR